MARVSILGRGRRWASEGAGRRQLLVLLPMWATALAFVAALAACQGPASSGTPAPLALPGVLTLPATLDFRGDPIGEQPFEATATGCRGADAFADIHEGTPVVVKDAAGTIIATTFLSIGTVTSGPGTSTRPGPPIACTLTFLAGEVPNADFYTVRVGNRDGPTYSRADLMAAGWQLQLKLGDLP